MAVRSSSAGAAGFGTASAILCITRAGRAGEAWPVLYVEDVERAAEAAGLVRKELSSFGMRVTLIPFDGVSERGWTMIDGVSVVARDQVVIDAYGGIDRMAERADILMGRS